MNHAELLKSVQAEKNENIPDLFPGDNVSVHMKIKEGDRERIQEFKGVVLYVRGNGNDATFTVRRVASNGIGVERTFLFNSPRIAKGGGAIRRARIFARTTGSARLFLFRELENVYPKSLLCFQVGLFVLS